MKIEVSKSHFQWLDVAKRLMCMSSPFSAQSWVYENPLYADTLLCLVEGMARSEKSLTETMGKLRELQFHGSHIWMTLNFLREVGLLDVFVDSENPKLEWVPCLSLKYGDTDTIGDDYLVEQLKDYHERNA